MQYDFLAIGDTTTDIFITLKDATVSCDERGEHCMLSMRFGDKIAYESVVEVRSVGNAPNAALAAHRLGLSSALISNVGGDRNGRDCVDALRASGLSAEFVSVHEGMVTNYSYVLRHEAERTILRKHEEYPYTFPAIREQPKWIYLTSLAPNSLPFHHELSAYLDVNPDVQLVFQPGTFQIKTGKENMKRLYARSELCVCNKEEARSILSSDSSSIPELIAGMHALGVAQVVITDGPRGSFCSDGSHVWSIPMYPDPAPPVDRTGAGDATTATTAALLAQGMTLPDALMRGAINSMSVVQYIGAQKGLLTREQIEEWYDKRPADFVPTQIS